MMLQKLLLKTDYIESNTKYIFLFHTVIFCLSFFMSACGIFLTSDKHANSDLNPAWL